MTDSEISLKAKAVLTEIAAALDRFVVTGEGWTIYIDKMGLDQAERQAIRDLLGEGAIRIKLTGSAEPAEWLESAVAGVWYGVFYDQSGRPLLETVEVAAFPAIAAAQPEDVKAGAAELAKRLKD